MFENIQLLQLDSVACPIAFFGRARYLAPKAKIARSNRVGCASFFLFCRATTRSPLRLRRSAAIKSGRRPEANVLAPASSSMFAFILMHRSVVLQPIALVSHQKLSRQRATNTINLQRNWSKINDCVLYPPAHNGLLAG